MKIGDTVLIPQGWTADGKERPYTAAQVVGFGRHIYSTRPVGAPDTATVRDAEGTWTLDVDSIKMEGLI